jgi:predicted Zn-dependent protease
MAEQNIKQAREYLDQGLIDEALKVLRQEMDANSNEPAVNEILGDIALYQGDGAEATWRYEQAKNFYLEKSEPVGAIVVTEKLAQLKPLDQGQQWRLAELYAEFGLKKEALKRFRSYAEAMFAHQDSERFLTAATRIAELEPQNLDLRFSFAKLLKAWGKVEAAAEELKRMIAELHERGASEQAAEVEDYLKSFGGSV